MNRRNFIAQSAAALPVLAVVTPPYRPIGYMNCDTVGAHDVERVTLDGREVEHVTELNDLEGWVIYLGQNPQLENGRLRQFHGKGDVRVYFRKAR